MTPITGPITLDPTGTKYVTREGRPVRIYAVDHNGAYPVIGAIMKNDGPWHIATWTRDGKAMLEMFDLFLAPPPKRKGKFWVNVYVNPDMGYWTSDIHLTRKSADVRITMTKSKRIACVPVEWTEGDGLEDQA